jgi:hypothetical protein
MELRFVAARQERVQDRWTQDWRFPAARTIARRRSFWPASPIYTRNPGATARGATEREPSAVKQQGAFSGRLPLAFSLRQTNAMTLTGTITCWFQLVVVGLGVT